jgi:hypothetical protein
MPYVQLTTPAPSSPAAYTREESPPFAPNAQGDNLDYSLLSDTDNEDTYNPLDNIFKDTKLLPLNKRPQTSIRGAASARYENPVSNNSDSECSQEEEEPSSPIYFASNSGIIDDPDYAH